MKALLTKSLEASFSYVEYRGLITHLLQSGKTTGHEQTEALVQYSELNEARLNRLDKTMVVIDEVKNDLQNLTKDYIWLVISEGWCGDAAQLVPIFNKMAEVSERIHLRIVLRDDNPELMDLFLTNGTRSIPKLIIIDKATMEVIGDFGPRPQGAKQLILDYKAEHGIVDEPAKIALQKWYLNDKGISTQKEIMNLMQ